MRVLGDVEVHEVNGAISSDGAYGAAVGVGVGLLGIALGITAPVWGTGLLLGGSIFASMVAIETTMRD